MRNLIERKISFHKRNRIIFVILILLMFLFEIGLVAASVGIKNKEELFDAALGCSIINGTFFIIIFICYALTLEYNRKWWIFPVAIISGLLSVFLHWLIFALAMGLLIERSTRIISKYRKELWISSQSTEKNE